YYMDWQDVQRSIGVPPPPGSGAVGSFTGLINSDSASGVGVDFGVVVQPTTGLELGANVSWNDLSSDADVLTRRPSGVDVLLFTKGERLDQSPERTLGGTIDYVFRMGAGGYRGRFSGGVNYLSEITTRLFTGNTL